MSSMFLMPEDPWDEIPSFFQVFNTHGDDTIMFPEMLHALAWDPFGGIGCITQLDLVNHFGADVNRISLSEAGHGNLISGWTSPDRLSFDQLTSFDSLSESRFLVYCSGQDV